MTTRGLLEFVYVDLGTVANIHIYKHHMRKFIRMGFFGSLVSEMEIVGRPSHKYVKRVNSDADLYSVAPRAWTNKMDFYLSE